MRDAERVRFGAWRRGRERSRYGQPKRTALVELRGSDPPAGGEALHWRLMTTHPIPNAESAWEIVGWYQRRWVIEQMFRVIKSQGLQLEDSQIATAERLVKLAAVAVKAACVDMQLTQARDGTDQMPASNVFSDAEIDTLAALGPTLEGKTERQQNPHPPRSLAWAGWSIARLAAAGTATTSPLDPLPFGAAWNNSTRSTAVAISVGNCNDK